ncbi:MAG: hypothetical protein A2W93_03960 [Bacteroidetes bacterium GWF2_43_63]|nr:MAG: hypothetical protein A2W94_06255 [Bacteroidetes bacterium GWE2_42_42]OFY54337.1 MAG: hypothetical protein A2W93_03960 [Bacteroidetes bacterium GWF2_43_63]HBG69274.1 hypothetical protein [Bacteroidales bacterium]HCB61170.1 hypothetical protein [Bacteroidales bacterium]HCY24090.1 hypothetical protein [Bacteroidales bacterium]
MKKLLLPLFVIILALTGCYYEEGPIISLRTPESRLVNKWKYEKFTLNGQDQMHNYQSSWVEFKKDKTAMFYEDTAYSYTAAWEFSDDFKTLYLNCTDDTFNTWEIDYNILKLRDKELWMESDLGSLTMYLELVAY